MTNSNDRKYWYFYLAYLIIYLAVGFYVIYNTKNMGNIFRLIKIKLEKNILIFFIYLNSTKNMLFNFR